MPLTCFTHQCGSINFNPGIWTKLNIWRGWRSRYVPLTMGQPIYFKLCIRLLSVPSIDNLQTIKENTSYNIWDKLTHGEGHPKKNFTLLIHLIVFESLLTWGWVVLNADTYPPNRSSSVLLWLLGSHAISCFPIKVMEKDVSSGFEQLSPDDVPLGPPPPHSIRGRQCHLEHVKYIFKEAAQHSYQSENGGYGAS